MQVGSRIVGERIGLQPRPEVFDRIELRSVWRQVLQMCRAGKNALIDELALMGLEAIPDEHDRRAQLSLQMFEEVQGELGVDVGSRMEPKVQGNPVARGCDAQSGDSGDLLVVLAALMKHRSLSAQAPGAPHQGGHEHAGFVEKDDGCSQACGVFFTRGQSCAIQAWMRSSSRSRERRVGFWGEKPKPCRSRLTCAG